MLFCSSLQSKNKTWTKWNQGLSSQDKTYSRLLLKKELKKYSASSELNAKIPQYFSSALKKMFLYWRHKGGLTITGKLRKFFLHRWRLFAYWRAAFSSVLSVSNISSPHWCDGMCMKMTKDWRNYWDFYSAMTKRMKVFQVRGKTGRKEEREEGRKEEIERKKDRVFRTLWNILVLC